MIFETDIREFSGLRVRIQMRQCLDGTVQQRHIWYFDGQEHYDPPRYDPWISAAGRNWALLTRNMRAAPHELDEYGELLAALREIADGHNDARGRAREALKRAGLTQPAQP